jgi:hypothetical protein
MLCDGLEISLTDFFDTKEFRELEQEIKYPSKKSKRRDNFSRFFAHFYYFRLPFLCKSTFIQKIVEIYSKGFAKIKKYVIIVV